MTKRRKNKEYTEPVTGAGQEAEIESVLAAFRAATGLHVCFKLLAYSRAGTGLEAVSSRYIIHRSAFCMEVKRTRNERCKECDLRAVPARCEREKAIFSHMCHAGAGEVIVPLFVDETLAAVVYAGQFRTGDQQPVELPLFTAAKVAEVEALARMLAAYLGERLRTPRFVSESSRGYRAESVRRFLEKNLKSNPSLPELAAHLGLSVTRTAHAVREATGNSFVESRDALRLERAKALLRGTYHKIGYVAAECGFASAQYFHRFFRGKAGMTPLAYRKKYREEV
jgi:AraC-like DNA-binding protein